VAEFIRPTIDTTETARQLNLSARAVEIATQRANLYVAREVVTAERAEMSSVFDRPIRYTLNSFKAYRVRSRLESVVELKGVQGVQDENHKYLNPQIYGGDRTLTGFEYKLRQRGILPAGAFVVPGGACPKDAYGNVPTGLVQQVLSYLSASEGHGGANQNTTVRTVKRIESNIGRRIFGFKGVRGRLIVYRGRADTIGRKRAKKDGTSASFKSRLPHPGIWVRAEIGGGDSVRPLFMFVSRPKYKARFDFYGIARKVINSEYPRIFNAAAQREFEKAAR